MEIDVMIRSKDLKNDLFDCIDTIAAKARDRYPGSEVLQIGYSHLMLQHLCDTFKVIMQEKGIGVENVG